MGLNFKNLLKDFLILYTFNDFQIRKIGRKLPGLDIFGVGNDE